MTAPTLEIGRLRARYRLPTGDERTRARLDRLLAAVVDEGLEAALLRAGVAAGEEVCIRAVRAPVRLLLAGSDAAVCAAWSSAIVAAIDAAAAGAGRDVVRYASRARALEDVVHGVARNDFQNAWAWRRLGLWRLGDEPTAVDAADALVETLCTEAHALVPVLAAAARSGAFADLLALLDDRHWTVLAGAALESAGAPRALLRNVTAAGARPVETDRLKRPDTVAERPGSAGAAWPPELRAVGAAVVRRSAIAQALPYGRIASIELVSALAILALLEDDPAGLTAAGPADARARSVADLLEARAAGPAATDPGGPAAAAVAPLPQAVTPEADVPEAARGHADDGVGTGDQQEGPEDGDEAAHATERFTTRFGGILFLLGLVEELGLPKRPPAALTPRRLRWVLHRLALVLQPVENDDPAALAFAGLAPNERPPTEAEDPATPEELEAIDEVRDQIVALLRDRLGEAHRPPDELLDFVCRRRAEVVADPGWIELCFSLDDVAIELRRAGLDLDPGYLPWLGTFVRFAYV